MIDVNDPRYRVVIEIEYKKLLKKAEINAVCKLNNGKIPKKKILEKLKESEDFSKYIEIFKEELEVDKLKAALNDFNILNKFAKEDRFKKRYEKYCKRHKTEKEIEEERERERQEELIYEEVENYVENFDLIESANIAIEYVFKKQSKVIENYLSLDKPVVLGGRVNEWGYYREYQESLSETNFEDFLFYILEKDFSADEILNKDFLNEKYIYYILGECDLSDLGITDYIVENDSFLSNSKYKSVAIMLVSEKVAEEDYNIDIKDKLQEYFTKEKIFSLLEKNPFVKELMYKYRLLQEHEKEVEKSILDKIPDNIIDLYPLARKIHRNFILHVGPTNSGKTFKAIEDLKEIGEGIYLGPLRLLAFEQYENLNQDGYSCDLVTGEEKLLVKDAKFIASTIEMVNLSNCYKGAVIDEAQMLADPARGGAWTSAILGLYCKNIFVCLSEDALDLIIQLIELCGDEYKIVRHERKVPLEMEQNTFNFPKDVKSGDALIVFTKRNVHAVASELQKKNIKCSIIYGSLPYDVRHEEARRFAEGETEILVATDAIGMGMNLPIKRVVFLENVKFDGKEKRRLTYSEVKQIAGRAGRFGKYDIGFVSTCHEHKYIKKAIEVENKSIENAVLSFPESLLGVDDKVSGIMKKWLILEEREGFLKTDLAEKLILCNYVEDFTEDKQLVYALSMLSFDSKIEEVLEIWKILVRLKSEDIKPDFKRLYKEIPENTSDLHLLETAYKVCDLIYAFSDKFGYFDQLQISMNKKKDISNKIIAILKEKKLEGRKCKYCGKDLAWNFPYSMCSNSLTHTQAWGVEQSKTVQPHSE